MCKEAPGDLISSVCRLTAGGTQESVFLTGSHTADSGAPCLPPSGHWTQLHCAGAIFSKLHFSGNQGSSWIPTGLAIKLEQRLKVKPLVFSVEPQSSDKVEDFNLFAFLDINGLVFGTGEFSCYINSCSFFT